MPYYKDLNNKPHWLDSEEFAYKLPAGSVKISDDEANTIINGLNALSPADEIKMQIMVLESSITPRRMREAVLGIDNGWLADIENQIVQLRAQL